MAIAPAVETFLRARRVSYVVWSHPPAYTAREEATAAHVRRCRWAKTVVCFADEAPIQAVVSADLLVDLARLQDVAGAFDVRLADERALAALYPGCELGAIPPLGPLYGQRVFLDEALAEEPELAFSAGTHGDALVVETADYLQVATPVVGSFGAICRPWTMFRH